MVRARAAYLPLVTAVIFWGISFISIKAALETFPPATLGLVRYVLAFLLLAPLKRLRAPGARPERRDLLMVVGSGLVGITLYFVFENNGVRLSTPSEASLIIGTIPVALLVAERAIDRTTLGPRGWIGAAATLGGIALIVAEGLSFSGSVAGYLFMLGSCATWVAYSFMTRGLLARYPRLAVVHWQSLAGLVGFIPLALLELPSIALPDLATLGHVAFLGICCSALGYYFYGIALESLGPARSGLFINLIPVVTVATSAVLGQAPGWTQVAGGLIVIGGVLLATWPGRGQSARAA